ncbi:MAG: hypothetical protein ABI429_01980 [Jatrophihabitantaceae bacterium]
MPRQNRRRDDDLVAARASTSVGERREDWRGEQYVVRGVSASRAVKLYRCPGCDQEVRPGVPHVVTWPAFDEDAGERRHWHTPCWRARETRAPRQRR